MCSVWSLPQSSDLHKRKRTWQAAQVLCCWLLLPGGALPRGKESLRCVREQAMETGQRVPVIHSATFSHNASTPGQWARVPVIQQPAASSQQPVQEPAASSSAVTISVQRSSSGSSVQESRVQLVRIELWKLCAGLCLPPSTNTCRQAGAERACDGLNARCLVGRSVFSCVCKRHGQPPHPPSPTTSTTTTTTAATTTTTMACATVYVYAHTGLSYAGQKSHCDGDVHVHHHHYETLALFMMMMAAGCAW